MNKNNCYLASKPRYEILDGLRGVAAMIIVTYHLFETYTHNSLEQHINHGYLAVDFFFMLSGFVIGYAYDDRWNRMSTLNFFKRRLIRLHPMVIFSCVLGVLFFYFTGCDSEFPLVDKTPWWMLLFIFLWCCTIIPVPQSLDIRGWAETNPINGPVWSLQWEYLANILYALVIRRFSNKVLTICVVLFAAMTIALCLNIDWLGVFEDNRMAAYTVIGGWSMTPDQLLIGASRLLYPFFMGLLLSRLGKLIHTRGAFWWSSLLIAIILIMPRIGGIDHMWMNGTYEAIAIIAIFPLIVMMGAGGTVSGKSAKLCIFLGELSYPLYITHFPLVYLQKSWVHYHPNAPLEHHIAIAVSVFFLAIFNAWAAYKLYDVPVREWLQKRLFTISKK